MIERVCPKCNIPMNGERCVNPKCGHLTEMASTIYWCKECNVPIYDKNCPCCGNEGEYIATDVRPVFPEENMLISILMTGNAMEYQKDSVWYGSNAYIINGKKAKLSVSNINKHTVDEIDTIRQKYADGKCKLTYEYFEANRAKFVSANHDRYNEITEEATRAIQEYKSRYSTEDMMVSFSGGKDSTVTSHVETVVLMSRVK